MVDAIPPPADDPARPDRCWLSHRLFATLGTPMFRRSESGDVPVVVIPLGERDAVLPFTALEREFNIPPDSEDGRMLHLIAASLDFVSVLRSGDPLPSEVVSGAASWKPDPGHLQIATARLRMQLIEWLDADSGRRSGMDATSLLAAAEDPALRRLVQTAIGRAATALGLASPTDVVQRIERLGGELAYIEALRDRLLRRAQAMAAKIERLSRGWHGGASQVETVGQVKRLSAIALRTIAGRFEELDGQTSEVITALRNVESQQALIRGHRDWLYRSQRAWEPILHEWDRTGEMDGGTLALLHRTYRFLAPRFMPVTEWISTLHPARKPSLNSSARMIW
ncbi:MAG TPA: hypothetical protein VFW75_09680 [Acetobacteraceae bacterium]|nr:hypothetical protein [Acetobacteraceae bacterium]